MLVSFCESLMCIHRVQYKKFKWVKVWRMCRVGTFREHTSGSGFPVLLLSGPYVLVPSGTEVNKTGKAPVLRLPHLIALLASFVQDFKPQSVWTLGRDIVQNVFSVRHRMEWESLNSWEGRVRVPDRFPSTCLRKGLFFEALVTWSFL